MATYRFTGVKKAPKATGGCCEPVCGTATCGPSEKAGVQAEKATGGCCEPECSPATCA